jgi:hypothetical protein
MGRYMKGSGIPRLGCAREMGKLSSRMGRCTKVNCRMERLMGSGVIFGRTGRSM